MVQTFHNSFHVSLTADLSTPIHERLSDARAKAKFAVVTLKFLGFDAEATIKDKDGNDVPLEAEQIVVMENSQETEGSLRNLKKIAETSGFSADGVEDCFTFDQVSEGRKICRIDWAAVKRLFIDSGQTDADGFRELVGKFMTEETLKGVSLKVGK